MSKRIRSVLVYGANGVQGGAIARQLDAEGYEVRAVVRDPIKAAPLTAAGMNVVRADLGLPESLRAASDGADAVVLTLPLEWNDSTVLAWTRNAARAARAAGVRLMVLNTSTRLPAEASQLPAYELRREVESIVRELAPPCIVLRPPLFLENLLLPQTLGGIAQGVVAYPIPASVRVSWLAMDDLGSYVGAALRHPELAGSAVEIGGPEELDGPALARELGQAIGAALRYHTHSPADIERALAPQFGAEIAAGISRGYAWFVARPDTPLLRGTASALAPALRRPPLRPADWARQQLTAALAAAG